LVHSLRKFSPWLLDPVAFGPVARQNMVESEWWRKATFLMVAGKQAMRRSGGSNIPFHHIFPVT
jgi:hypothetical protein